MGLFCIELSTSMGPRALEGGVGGQIQDHINSSKYIQYARHMMLDGHTLLPTKVTMQGVPHYNQWCNGWSLCSSGTSTIQTLFPSFLFPPLLEKRSQVALAGLTFLILPTPPHKELGLQVCATTPCFKSYLYPLQIVRLLGSD